MPDNPRRQDQPEQRARLENERRSLLFFACSGLTEAGKARLAELDARLHAPGPGTPEQRALAIAEQRHVKESGDDARIMGPRPFDPSADEHHPHSHHGTECTFANCENCRSCDPHAAD